MSRLPCMSCTGIALALFSFAALAAGPEEGLATISQAMAVGFVAFVCVVIVGVYFMKSQNDRQAPVSRIFEKGEAIHSVGPDSSVTDCVRLMTARSIGALIVMEGTALKGIFTERDALIRVLAAGRDPGGTKVSEVMTRDPCCIPPTMSIAEAMELITRRRFRHLPVVEGGTLLAVVSSGDLTRWLVRDRMADVQELVGIAAGS
jgi:CBS domain-containing protein